MDSNEQTELMNKTDRLIDGEQMTTSGEGRLGGGRIKQKRKRTHGHGKQVVITTEEVGYERDR